jgi:hypothetical protein
MGYSQCDAAIEVALLGMLEGKSERSAPSRKNKYGRSASSSIANDVCEIVLFSIWQSTASYAVATWSRSRSAICSRDRKIRTRATVVQQKTGRPVQFELTGDVRASPLAWLERRHSRRSCFPESGQPAHHMSTRQYARLVDEWVTAIGLRPSEYGTHALRRTKAPMIYKATGNLRAIQILLGHTKIETPCAISVSTSRMR